jgi:hypothetical protein
MRERVPNIIIANEVVGRANISSSSDHGLRPSPYHLVDSVAMVRCS